MWETNTRAVNAASSHTTSESIDSDEVYFGVVANLFCGIFVVDVILRVLAERWLFILSKEWGWNMFDVFVSSTAVLEVSTPSGFRKVLRKLSLLRILRLLKIIKVTRNSYVISFIRELRLMVFSLTGSLKSLAWAVVLILIILAVCGIFFTDGVIAYCVQHDAMQANSTKEMRQYFGTVPAAILSLYEAMSGGQDWGIIRAALQPLPLEYTLLFISFISFAILALQNVVTAVFINTAMQRSQNDRELAVQQEMQNKKELTEIMTQVFIELDENNNGSLTFEEFEKHIEDDKVLAYLRARGIEIGQVQTLFNLLDTDQSGDIDMDEFVNGVIRLKGGPTSMDLAVLTYQVEWILHNITSLQKLLIEDRSS